MNEMLQIGELNFTVRRSTRRRTLGLTVDRRGDLVVHVPDSTEMAEIEHWVTTKLLWVYRKLGVKDRNRERAREPEFVSGEGFSYLGRIYRLKIVMHASEPLRFDGTWFHLKADARDQAYDRFRCWYIETGRNWLTQRVHILANRVGTRPMNVLVQDLGYRWGSCTRRGTILFNWRLLQLPVKLIDYVIVHELAHLSISHHGSQFWKMVERALPDWKSRKDAFEICAPSHLVFGVFPPTDPCVLPTRTDERSVV